MPVHTEFQEKIDVLDMIINILKEHEENLSSIAERLNNIGDDLAAMAEKISVFDQSMARLDGLKVKNLVDATGFNRSLIKIECKDWSTFRGVSQGALLIVFEVVDDQLFRMSSITDIFIYTYCEILPEFNEILLNEKGLSVTKEAGRKRYPLGVFWRDIIIIASSAPNEDFLLICMT